MNTVATWPSQAEAWLDDKGKPAWIAAMVLGFVFFWPVGLALLASMHRTHHGFKSSGNTAFDAYKAETLRRLEDEQSSFEEFLKRLREAKDKSEFDQFMDDRARKAREVGPENPTAA